MSFVNYPSNPPPLFPALPSVGWSVHKVPIFHTEVQIASSGREIQVARQLFPLWEFTLSYGGDAWLRDQTQNITPYATEAGFAELQQISGLFMACLGSYGEFYYDDPDDDSRLGAPVDANATYVNGLAVGHQIYFQFGNGPFTQPFFAPIGGVNTLDAVYWNGVVQDPSTYVVDASTNSRVVFVGGAPPAGTTITADIHFYYRCRFMDDIQEYDEWAENLWEYKTCKFRSVKS